MSSLEFVFASFEFSRSIWLLPFCRVIFAAHWFTKEGELGFKYIVAATEADGGDWLVMKVGWIQMRGKVDWGVDFIDVMIWPRTGGRFDLGFPFLGRGYQGVSKPVGG